MSYCVGALFNSLLFPCKRKNLRGRRGNEEASYEAYSMSKIFWILGELCSKREQVIKGFSSFSSSWPLSSKSFSGRRSLPKTAVCSSLHCFFSVGRWNSLFLFFRKHLKWSVVEYSRYTTILGVIGILAQYIVVPTLSERFKLHDATISLLDALTR